MAVVLELCVLLSNRSRGARASVLTVATEELRLFIGEDESCVKQNGPQTFFFCQNVGRWEMWVEFRFHLRLATCPLPSPVRVFVGGMHLSLAGCVSIVAWGEICLMRTSVVIHLLLSY